jgi:hypothetical protein
MIKINADKGYNNRFCKDWSPVTIGQPDPFNEEFSRLWNAGKKEEAKKFGRLERYIANIKVIKDPANPENEGKIFLFDMSKTLFGVIKNALQPTEDELAMGVEPKNVFNPIKGNSFLLKATKGDNGIITYTNSKFAEKEDGIYKNEKEAEEDIKANAYNLSDFLKPESFKSYEELKHCLAWLKGEKGNETSETSESPKTETEPKEEPKPETKPETKTEVKEEPKPETKDEVEVDDDLDDLLNELED